MKKSQNRNVRWKLKNENRWDFRIFSTKHIFLHRWKNYDTVWSWDWYLVPCEYHSVPHRPPQFNTRTTPFHSTPKILQFKSKNPSVQHADGFLVLKWGVYWTEGCVELRGVLNWGVCWTEGVWNWGSPYHVYPWCPVEYKRFWMFRVSESEVTKSVCDSKFNKLFSSCLVIE